MSDRVTLAAAVLFAMATPATAELAEPQWRVQVGAYFPDIDSNLRIDTADGRLGTGLDLERDLGFNRRSVLPAFLAEWRPGDDWLFTGEYYRLGRSTTLTLDRAITVGETVYPVAARIDSGFDSDIIRFTIGNRLFQSRDFELGAAIGVHATDFTVSVAGQGSVAGSAGQFRLENRSLFALLPTVGAFASYQPSARITLDARIDWLSLTIDDTSGRLVNIEASAAYALNRTIDIGLMYRLVDYRVDTRRTDWTGRVAYRFNGPAAFVQLRF